MSIRIGEDGSIISSEGEIQQGQNPLIGEDGSIRLNEQSASGGRSSYGGPCRVAWKFPAGEYDRI